MRRKITGLAAAAFLAGTLGATPALAQARGYIGFGAGLSIPTGTFGDCCKTGWLGQVVAGITGASGMLGGRIDGMYVRNSVKGTGGGKSKLIGVNADLVWTPGQRPAKIHPYLLGGLGFFNSDDRDETKLAFNVGAGLQVHMTERMGFFTEARFISIRTTGASTNFIPIAVGLRWGGV